MSLSTVNDLFVLVVSSLLMMAPIQDIYLYTANFNTNNLI
jgi:hypothetical protein